MRLGHLSSSTIPSMSQSPRRLGWRRRTDGKILERPAQSPYLKIIENLWWSLKKVLVPHKPKNISDLKANAHEEWTKSPQEHCQNVVSGYASCLQQVITA